MTATLPTFTFSIYTPAVTVLASEHGGPKQYTNTTQAQAAVDKLRAAGHDVALFAPARSRSRYVRIVKPGDAVPETVAVNGIGYNVIRSETPDSLDVMGLHGVADFLREHGIKRQLGLTRPNGHVTYIGREYLDGRLEVVTKF